MTLNLGFRNAPVSYVTATNKLSKKPVFYVKFGQVVGPLGTGSTALSNQYASGPILNATQTRKNLLYNPSAKSNQIDAITCHTTFSSMQFTLLDLNQEITTMVNNYSMKNRLVTIYAGYQDIPESDFVGFTGQIDNWKKTSDGTGVMFLVVGGLKNLLLNILSGHTILTQDFKKGDGIAYTVQLTGFAGATDLSDGQGARNYVKIDNCIYQYAGLGNRVLDGTCLWTFVQAVPPIPPSLVPLWTTSTAYTVGTMARANGNIYKCAFGGTSALSGNGPAGLGLNMIYGMVLVQPNGNGDKTDSDHSAGSNVDNFVLYQGNPITILLQILLSTGNGGNSVYDVFPQRQGVGIPQSLVNIKHIEAQRDKFLPAVLVQQYFTDTIQCVKFFEQEFLQQLCCWFFENRNGQADLSMFYVPVDTLDAVTIDDTLIIGSPQFDANLQTGNQFVNQVSVLYDWQPNNTQSSDIYLQQTVLFDSDSQVKYEEGSALEVKAKIFKTIFGGALMALRTANIFAALYKNPPPRIDAKMLYSTHLINVGDVVYFGSKFIPNYKNPPSQATPQLCVCIMVQPNFQAGNVQATFLGYGFNTTTKGRQAAIAPDNVPVYASASADQRKAYAFINDDATGLMPNGDPPYLITP